MKLDSEERFSGKQFMKGGVWTLTGKLLFALSAFIINVLLSRLLSTSEFGAFFLVFNFILFASTAGILGLQQSVIRFIAEPLSRRQYSEVRRVIGLILKLAVWGALVVTLLFLLLQLTPLFHLGNDWSAVLAIPISIWLFGYIFQLLLSETFRGLYDMKLAASFGGVVSNTLIICSLIVLSLSGYSLKLGAILIIHSLAVGLSNLIAALCLWRKLRRLADGVTPSEQKADNPPAALTSRSILAVSLPIMWSNLALFLLTATDLWILGWFRNEVEVAIYGSAVRFIAIINLFVIVLNAVMSTLISNRYSEGKLDELEQIGRWVTAALAIPGIVMWLMFVGFGDVLLGFVFGEIYSQAAMILIFLSAGQLMNLLMGPVGLVLMLTGNEKRMLAITLFCSAITFSGACLLAGPYGGIGVALMMLAGLMLQNGLMWFTVKRQLGISLHFSIGSLVSLVQAALNRLENRRAAKKNQLAIEQQ
ncbi:oligosaccharide flippase family protein [Paenibacillus senegalensis]|uniref:oligosaccharide flippase family protein n=1 Tax=Paenibacillus senegalensis TaxID=1465766 RepID=UPI0002887FBD|nr:oligosaccharide flippase family protein [Paenibacillus senegalensis]